MKTKNIFSVFSVFSGLACALPLAFAAPEFYAPGGLQRAEGPKPASDMEREARRGGERNRVISEYKKKAQCVTIYDGRAAEDCSDFLSVKKIAKLQHVYETLKNPASIPYDGSRSYFRAKYQNFLEDLSLFLEISPSPFIDLAENYNRREAKKMLAWIAASDRMAEIVHEHDGMDFDILKSLFKNAGLLGSSGWVGQNLYRGGYGLFDIISKRNNEPAFDYVHGFLISSPECAVDNRQCFNNYCAAADAFNFNIVNRGTAYDLLDFEQLEIYLEGVIANNVNKANWRSQDFQIVRDLSDDWWADLCSPLQSEEKELQGLLDGIVEAVGVEKARKLIDGLIKEEAVYDQPRQ